jgi:hypothetical protein
MFEQNRLGKNRTQASGTTQTNNSGEQMDEQADEISHSKCYQEEKRSRLRTKLAIRHQTPTAA